MKFGNHEVRIHWRIKELMQQRGLRRVIDLHDQLKQIDPDGIERTRLFMMVKEVPKRITLQTLAALMVALRCDLTELLDIEVVPLADEKQESLPLSME